MKQIILGLLLALQLTAVHAVETVVYYHNDALGSPVAATDENGNLLWQEEYEPYGSRILKQDNGSNRLWYTGKPEESLLGIQYFGARWYDPTIGQLMGVDPVGFQEGNVHSFNRYTYANNNPYFYVDPDGKYGIPGAIYGTIAGGTGGYIASGGTLREKIIGSLSGAIAGGVVGFAAPQTSHLVGLAAAGAIASATGQAIGSTANAAIDKGVENVTFSDVKVDAVSTAAGGLGAGAGGMIGKGVASMTARPIVGTTIEKAGTATTTGLMAGAVVEGAVIGVAEKAAGKSKKRIE